MKKLIFSLSLLALTSNLSINLSVADDDTALAQPSRIVDDLSKSFEQVAESITPSVVTISTETKAKKAPRGGNNGGGQDAFRDFFG